ncbi:TPA: ATP-binding protein [Candidatus Woesearchaeota archaeon]|nr:ATP-binding protein [Candidatus Woesearchaeota archaeon]HIH31171.1 ATP-binding protein [Candidatus Woesearchaeota archaeon]HIH55561.1 ATP-binding protein [Candidatus Woesearchaeota archaeon]HIJ01816.1 ATP-binding protein [Candidatus Woesearchaeota archaeon]HIJ13111.1 ATP-binding protein [Candidatus Woesearchaeota archaeon]
MNDAIKATVRTTFKDIGIYRYKYLEMIENWLSRPEIIIIKGVRRSGKSTILKQIASRLRKAVYVNFDDYRLLPYLNIDLLEEIIKTYRDAKYFFFDEIQKIPKFESWLRTHYDIKSHKKFIISGSNISLLSPKLGTVLTGRNITFEIFPLNYQEFKAFKGGSFEQYIKFGGFPEIVLEKNEEKKMQLLMQYFNDILLRDILEKHQIAPTQQFKAMAQYIIANTGLKISANKLAKELGINSRTAENYLSHMVDAYLIFEVPYFSYSAKTKYLADRASKYYCIDNGLTSALSAKTNKGHLFEAITAQALRRNNQELYYWSGKKEVDFIQKQTAYQVSLTTINESAFSELKECFKHIEKTVAITPNNFEKNF